MDGLIKGVVGAVGSAVAGVASADADPSKPIASFGDVVSKTGEKMGVFGSQVVFVGESLKAMAAVMQAIDKTADRYGEYSPQIAQAQAVAEIRQVMGDLRRVQKVGADLAEYVLARSELQQRFEDTKVKILTKILPIITRALEILEAAMSGGEEIMSSIGGPLRLIADGIAQLVNLKRDEKMNEIEDPTMLLLKQGDFDKVGLGVPNNSGLVPRW